MQAVEKITNTNDWVTILFFALFACIFLLQLIDGKKLKKFFFIFFTFSLIEDEDLTNKSFFDVSQIIIFVFTTGTLALLAYQFKLYNTPESISNFSAFFPVYIKVFSFFLVKRFLEYILILLLMLKKHVQLFMFLKNNYLYGISFLLYIALILTQYARIGTIYLFFFALFLFLVRFVFLVRRNKKLIFNKLFYFILYICALEIAPLFLLFKLMF